MFSHRGDRGLAAVELALVTPVMLGVVLGAVEYGNRFAQEGQYNNAALIAARKVAISNDATAARTTAINAVTSNSQIANQVVVTFTYTKGTTLKCGVDSSDGSYGDVTVEVSRSNIPAVTPLPTLIPGVQTTYRSYGKAVFRCGG